jgi:hypothetical protein
MRIEHWPQITASVTKVELTPPGALTPTTEARISQPRFGTNTWRVTALDPGKSFTWESSRPGSKMVATHTVTLLGWLLARTGRRLVEMEAEGVKHHAEAT